MTAEQKMLDIPSPPGTAEAHGHYFVYGEWVGLRQESSVATLDNPNPTGQVVQIKYGKNEAIAMHPAVYAIVIQQARPGYTVRAWSGISQELFDWYRLVERKINQALAGVNGRI